jgi:hypothetical protein
MATSGCKGLRRKFLFSEICPLLSSEAVAEPFFEIIHTAEPQKWLGIGMYRTRTSVRSSDRMVRVRVSSNESGRVEYLGSCSSIS